MNNPSVKMEKALSKIKLILKCRFRTEKFSFYRIKKMKTGPAFGWLKEARKGQYNFLSMMISATLWVSKKIFVLINERTLPYLAKKLKNLLAFSKVSQIDPVVSEICFATFFWYISHNSKTKFCLLSHKGEIFCET